MKEKDLHKDTPDTGMTRGQFLKLGLGVALGAAVFGIAGCREQAALGGGNVNIPVPQNANFIADTRSKVYHKITCKNKPTKGQLVFFDSPVAAQRSGFVPCRACRPNHI